MVLDKYYGFINNSLEYYITIIINLSFKLGFFYQKVPNFLIIAQYFIQSF